MLRRPDLPKKWKYVCNFHLVKTDASSCASNRKELQRMLHSRRKAEIEILSSMDSVTASQQPPSASAGQGAAVQYRRNGLLEYVVSKVNKAVDTAKQKYGS